MMNEQRGKRLQEDLENRLMNKAAAVACWCHNSQNKGVFPETLPVSTLYPVTGHFYSEASELFIPPADKRWAGNQIHVTAAPEGLHEEIS